MQDYCDRTNAHGLFSRKTTAMYASDNHLRKIKCQVVFALLRDYSSRSSSNIPTEGWRALPFHYLRTDMLLKWRSTTLMGIPCIACFTTLALLASQHSVGSSNCRWLLRTFILTLVGNISFRFGHFLVLSTQARDDVAYFYRAFVGYFGFLFVLPFSEDSSEIILWRQSIGFYLMV